MIANDGQPQGVLTPHNCEAEHLGTLARHIREAARAKVAAAYLYLNEGADELVWKGLEYRGIDYVALLDRIGPIVLRSAIFDAEISRFAIDALGEQAFVHAVHGEDPQHIIDIVAWSAMPPHRYGTFLGYAGLLGADAALNPASFIEEPCPIWSGPLPWLQSGLRGCVVLCADLAAPILARAPGLFQCEDATHCKWLVERGAVAVEKLLVPQRTAA
jgi:hypothetical protein